MQAKRVPVEAGKTGNAGNTGDPGGAGTGWRYSPVAVWLHWLLALLIAGMLALGFYMMSVEDDPGSARWFNLHKSIGLVVLALVLLRVLWRAGHRPAELPASVPSWEVKASSVMHWLLYASMLVMPITGLIGGGYTKFGVAFFGANLPRWAQPNHDAAELFFEFHETVAWILIALIAVHALAGFKHLWINRDRVFQRMWF